MPYARGMAKDILLSFFAGMLTMIIAFMIIANALDWLWFRDLPEDATRGLTVNFYSAPLGLAAGLIAGIAIFAWRRNRRET